MLPYMAAQVETQTRKHPHWTETKNTFYKKDFVNNLLSIQLRRNLPSAA